MHFTRSLVTYLLGAALTSAVALDLSLLHEENTAVSSDPPKGNPQPKANKPPPPPPPPAKGNSPPPKAKHHPLGTNPFASRRATAAQWDRWASHCRSRKRADVGQDGVRGNLGYETLETSNLRTCFGVAIVGRVTTGTAPPKSTALLWHMSGSANMLNLRWDEVVGIINDSGLVDMTAYLSVPADSQPHVPDWAAVMEPVHKEALDELKKALEKVDVKHVKVKTRADASVGASMKVDGSLRVSVDHQAF